MTCRQPERNDRFAMTISEGKGKALAIKTAFKPQKATGKQQILLIFFQLTIWVIDFFHECEKTTILWQFNHIR